MPTGGRFRCRPWGRYECRGGVANLAGLDIARGKNQLHTIFENHFSEFCDQYDERFAQKYGRFRLRRIESVAERFGTCGDYRHGVARIRCTNPECGHDHFRPFSCLT